MEVLVCLLIVLLVVPMLAGLQIHSIKLSQRSNQADMAVFAAQALFEEIRLTDYDVLADGSDTFTLPDGTVFTRDWDVRMNQPVPGMKEVTVEVVDAGIEDAEAIRMVFAVSER